MTELNFKPNSYPQDIRDKITMAKAILAHPDNLHRLSQEVFHPVIHMHISLNKNTSEETIDYLMNFPGLKKFIASREDISRFNVVKLLREYDLDIFLSLYKNKNIHESFLPIIEQTVHKNNDMVLFKAQT